MVSVYELPSQPSLDEICCLVAVAKQYVHTLHVQQRHRRHKIVSYLFCDATVVHSIYLIASLLKELPRLCVYFQRWNC